MDVQKATGKRFTKRQIQGMAMAARLEEARKTAQPLKFELPEGYEPVTADESVLLQLVLFKVRDSPSLDPLDILVRIDAAIPESGPDPWDALIGPFYTTRSLAVTRGVTRQALQRDRVHDRVLWVRTADDKVLYPAFQFDAHGRAPRHLGDVLRTLGTAIPDGWTRALWLTGPVEAWGGESAIDKLHRGTEGDVAEVLAEAAASVAARTRR